jgi:hypothetical protein
MSFQQKLDAAHKAAVQNLNHAITLLQVFKPRKPPARQDCRLIIDNYLALRENRKPFRVLGAELGYEYSRVTGAIGGTISPIREHRALHDLMDEVSRAMSEILLAGLPPVWVFRPSRQADAPADEQVYVKGHYVPCKQAFDPEWLTDKLIKRWAAIRKLMLTIPSIDYRRRGEELVDARNEAMKEWLLLNSRSSSTDKKRGPKFKNTERDKWVEEQREKGRRWHDIYVDLIDIGHEREWSVPNDEKALSEAQRRHLRGARQGKAAPR